jgi:hypothetical protein
VSRRLRPTLTSNKSNPTLEVKEGVTDDIFVGWVAHVDGVLREMTRVVKKIYNWSG